jgi:hypothetical protein
MLKTFVALALLVLRIILLSQTLVVFPSVTLILKDLAISCRMTAARMPWARQIR